MQLRKVATYPTFEDYTGKSDPSLLEPKIGESYVENPIFYDVLEELNHWNMKSGLAGLDALIEENDTLLDAVRLKAEVLATYECHQAAWEQYDLLLEHAPDDAHALAMTVVLATILGDEEEAQSRKQALRKLHPQWERVMVKWLAFIAEHQTRTDFEEHIDGKTHIDFLAVYGCGLQEDGAYPESLLHRLRKTADFAHQFPHADIIVSGGAVANSFNEAEAMAKWLLDQGIEEQRIIQEPLAKDTVGNSIGITDIVKGKDYQSCCVITSLMHLPRAWMSLMASFQREEIGIPVFGAAYEPPRSLVVADSELKLSYHTTFRSAGLFTKNDFQEDLE